MLFSSITFLVLFLPIVILCYYFSLTIKNRNIILLIFSIIFYAWGEPKYVFLMIASIMINYRIGIELGKLKFTSMIRKLILSLGIIINISVLFIFKYLGFSSTLINVVFVKALNIDPIPIINIVMPIGISFYTFQALSYLVDVYRKPEIVQNSLLSLGLYITFFPQLIAGPIVRYHDINLQIEQRSSSISMFSAGVERFIIGLSKKVLLANNFALVADTIYSLPYSSYTTFYSWIAIIAYSLQIFFDFSGYSDMAIGLGKMFGFSFLENFNYPYAAKSITDFWRRWHISLSSWFKDYIYIPLGGNRKGIIRTSINLYIVFLLTGLWHGASINFILWGLGHGTLLFIEKKINFTNLIQSKFLIILSHIYTIFSIMILWVFFRNGTKDSIKIILKMFGINYTMFTNDHSEIINSTSLYRTVDNYFYILLFIGVLFSFPWWRSISKTTNLDKYSNSFRVIKYFILIVLFIFSFASLANNSYNPFIYFRF